MAVYISLPNRPIRAMIRRDNVFVFNTGWETNS